MCSFQVLNMQNIWEKDFYLCINKDIMITKTCRPTVFVSRQLKGSELPRINSLLQLRNIVLLDAALDLCGCHGWRAVTSKQPNKIFISVWDTTQSFTFCLLFTGSADIPHGFRANTNASCKLLQGWSGITMVSRFWSKYKHLCELNMMES